MDIQYELLRAGFERYSPNGDLVLLAASIRNGQFVRAAIQRQEFLLGAEEDPDAEGVAICVISQIQVDNLASYASDIADTLKKNLRRLAYSDGVGESVLVTDMTDAKSAAALVEERLDCRFRLRTGGHHLTPRRAGDEPYWQIAPEALLGAFTARVSSGQVTTSPDADPALVSAALRAAADPALGAETPSTRALAWACEVALRPLISPTNRLAPLPKAVRPGLFAFR